MHAMSNACGETKKKVKFSRFLTIDNSTKPECLNKMDHIAIYNEIDYSLQRTMRTLSFACANSGRNFPSIPDGVNGTKSVGAAIVSRLVRLLDTACAYPYTSYDFEGNLKEQEVECPIDEYIVQLLTVALPGFGMRCKDVCLNPRSAECIGIQGIIGKYIPPEFEHYRKHILYLFDMHMSRTFKHSFFGINYEFTNVKSGGGRSTTYKNKTYKVQQGARGGRFIRVKTAQGTFKKVYL